jgi:chromosome segregation ATPase
MLGSASSTRAATQRSSPRSGPASSAAPSLRPRPRRRSLRSGPPRQPPAGDKVDRTLAQRRAAQQARLGAAESDYATAAAERDQAERVLDAHQHRLADLQTDLDRLNDQLEGTRQALRGARKQLPRLQRAFHLAARNAAAVRKRRDTEQQRLNALEH